MSVRESILRLLQDIASVFLPFSCHRCKTDTDFGVVFCDECQKKLASAMHPPRLTDDTRCDFDLHTLSSYNSLVADVIRIIKYRPSAKLLNILASTCCQNCDLRSIIDNNDIIVPVPMHSQRLHSRGFNQAKILAANFAKDTGCRCNLALERIRATRPQADCNEEERRDNLKNAFALSKSSRHTDFKNSRIIIIDDVATTGSTLQLCANKLKELKPAKISALVVSHSYKQIV